MALTSPLLPRMLTPELTDMGGNERYLHPISMKRVIGSVRWTATESQRGPATVVAGPPLTGDIRG